MAKVLLVDDDDSVRKMLKIMLTRAGYEVEAVADGSIAWEKYLTWPADIVIMDLIMPVQEGVETIRQFRRNGSRAKILAVSGGGRMDARDLLAMAELLGADKALTKPFTQEALLSALKSLLPQSA